MRVVLLTSYALQRDALLSVVARAWEVYGAEKAVVVVSDRVLPYWRRDQGVVREALEAMGAGVELDSLTVSHPVPGGGGKPASAALREVLRSLASKAAVVVSPTPASRRLAAHLGMAVGGVLASKTYRPSTESMVSLIHVDFCFAQWRGLYYPLVPRACVPVIESEPRLPGSRDRVAKRLPAGPPRRLLERLPPLRRRVASLAYMVNSASSCPATVSESGEAGCTGETLEARLHADGVEASVTVKGVCRPQSWAEALPRVAKMLDKLEDLLGAAGGQLRLYTGVEKPAAAGTLEPLSGSVVADTSLVYRGLHNLAYSGVASPVLPQCLLAEVARSYAENTKRSAPPGAALLALLAYTALEELKAAGAAIAPSPPGPCDVAIPEMPPTILAGSRLATSDRGAYHYWLQHPALAKIVGAENIVEATTGAEARDPGEAMYAVLQALVVASTAAKLLREKSGADAHLEVRLGGRKLNVEPLDTPS